MKVPGSLGQFDFVVAMQRDNVIERLHHDHQIALWDSTKDLQLARHKVFAAADQIHAQGLLLAWICDLLGINFALEDNDLMTELLRGELQCSSPNPTFSCVNH